MNSSVQEHRTISPLLHRYISTSLQGSVYNRGRGKQLKPALAKGQFSEQLQKKCQVSEPRSPEHWAGFERTLRGTSAQGLQEQQWQCHEMSRIWSFDFLVSAYYYYYYFGMGWVCFVLIFADLTHASIRSSHFWQTHHTSVLRKCWTNTHV